MSESGEHDRIARLEWLCAQLRKEIDEEVGAVVALKKEVVDLEKELETTKNKIARAESWGRGVMWAMIAIGGALTQMNTFITWLKKH